MPGISGFVFKNDKKSAENIMALDPVKTTDSPPIVPKYWKIGRFTTKGSSGHDLRSELFCRLMEIGVHISLVCNWTYRLEYVNGPNYVDIECYFWSVSSGVVAELQLMSGERFTWGNLWKSINDKYYRIKQYRLPDRTPPQMIKYLESGEGNPEFISIFGSDVPDRLLVRFLGSSDLNIVRHVMSMLKEPIDTVHFRFWAQKKPGCYLETLICNSVHNLLSKKSRI